MARKPSLIKLAAFAVAAVGLALLGGGLAMAQTSSLTGVTWQWTGFRDLNQRMEVLTPNQTVTFNDDGSFTGRADCNRVAGGFSVDGDAITLSAGPSTLAACPEGSLGDVFVQRLLQAESFDVEDGVLVLALASGGSMSFEAQPLVTGSVTYLQRSALPEGSVVRVQVQDVSVADAQTIIIGEDVIVIAEQQVPIDFAVPYPEEAIQDWRRYSVSVRITDPDGRLLFVSDTNNPVLTGGAPTSDIEIVLVPVQR